MKIHEVSDFNFHKCFRKRKSSPSIENLRFSFFRLRTAAIVAIEILDKNSRFTKKHSSKNLTSFLKPMQPVQSATSSLQPVQSLKFSPRYILHLLQTNVYPRMLTLPKNAYFTLQSCCYQLLLLHLNSNIKVGDLVMMGTQLHSSKQFSIYPSVSSNAYKLLIAKSKTLCKF